MLENNVLLAIVTSFLMQVKLDDVNDPTFEGLSAESRLVDVLRTGSRIVYWHSTKLWGRANPCAKTRNRGSQGPAP